VESVGVVREFDAGAGWGVLDSPDAPGGCFVHYSHIEMPGFKELTAGQQVAFTFETPGFLQDGYRHRALVVRVLDE
jgi:CspA family cold shock protein